MIGIVIATHGLFGQELLHTAEDMVGRQENAAALAVTPDTGVEGLKGSIDQILQRLQGPDGVLFLVDMIGGSPCNAVLLKTKDIQADVVTGVNLYMVLSAFRNRCALGLKELATKASEDGKKSILQPKDLLLKKLG